MQSDVKEKLHVHHRSLRTHPGMLLLGSTGARLWADALDCTPGFSGSVDFIHKMNLPLLFAVRVEGRSTRMEPVQADWYPDELRQKHEEKDFTFAERKLITWDDVAVSCQTWKNHGRKSLKLELVLPENLAMDEDAEVPCHLHGLNAQWRIGSTAAWSQGTLMLAPGEQKTFLVAAALALKGENVLEQRLARVLRAESTPDETMDHLCEEYMAWFQHVPRFTSSDQFMERCWLYRFYILRSNLAKPGYGYLPHHVFYEGRSHRMKKVPYQATGWEFSRLITLSTPLTMADAQWLTQARDIQRDAFRSLACSVGENGVFTVTAVDEHGKEYANYAAWALYQYYLVSGDAELVKEVLPAFKMHVRSVHCLHHSALDSLQVCREHPLTGKEYQPSYWYFAEGGYPLKVRPAKEGYTPLRRVDCSIYLYLNAEGLHRLCDQLADGDGNEFAALAEQVKHDVLCKMWNEEEGFFFDLHEKEERQALVRNVVGVYPLWADITENKHLRALEQLTDSRLFARGSAFASAAADCPVYSPCGGWMGQYIKGRDGCMWNGPSWPYTTAIALDALARQSKEHGHCYDDAFARYLHEYTLEHFHEGDMDAPYLVEFYNSETGEPLSDEPDYNHSFYADLVVRHVAGITPTEQGVSFRPVAMPVRYFSLENIEVRGHRLNVYYQQEDGLAFEHMPCGYTLLLDGKTILQGWKIEDKAVDIALA